jgi:hypothetical protein
LAVFNAVAQEVETTVSGGVTVAVATSGDGETFNRVMAERIGIGYISSLTLLRSAEPGVEEVGKVGRRPAVLPEQLDTAFVEQTQEIAGSGRLELVALSSRA